MLLGVDVGGTFTDAVLLDKQRLIATAKVPSTPQDQSVGVLSAIQQALQIAGVTPSDVRRFAHGMTVATNALLEEKVARTTLLLTEGFTDLIALARQNRPHLYRLCQPPPAPLSHSTLPVPERMTPEGPLTPLTQQQARAVVERLAAQQPEAVGVVLLHSYAHPQHEQLLGELIAQALPNTHLSLSHDLIGTFREYERAASTEIDAALSPLLSSYLNGLTKGAKRIGLVAPQVMQSSGGLIDAGRASSHAALTVLSGPAGGVGGALLLAEAAGQRNVLCFDMGGTSCDVCLITDGAVAETAERSIGGRPLALPALDVHTVGAGGGSIAWRDAGGALRVGPRSAGAEPGPACYGNGGIQPTVTDANLLLGRLPADSPLAGGVKLNRELAERVIGLLADSLDLDLIACAEGIVRVAEAEMLRALRVISVQRGIDPRGHALMCFGGAGPLHAASLAGELGISKILCPRASGVLCALGLAAAAPRRDVSKTVMLAGESLNAKRLVAERDALVEKAVSDLDLEGEGWGGPARPALRVLAEMRYVGQSHEIPVEVPDGADEGVLCEAFARAHEQRYGYREDDDEVELVTLRVSAIGRAPMLTLTAGGRGAPGAPGGPGGPGGPGAPAAPMRRMASVVLDGQEIAATCLHGELPPGTQVSGPAICALPEATLLVPPGWSGVVDPQGTIVLNAEAGAL